MVYRLDMIKRAVTYQLEVHSEPGDVGSSKQTSNVKLTYRIYLFLTSSMLNVIQVLLLSCSILNEPLVE
jgi:hypothetical protein